MGGSLIRKQITFYSSLDDVIKNLKGLSQLQHLTFRENLIAKKNEYRVTLFNHIRTLISLDGMDKHGKKDMNSQGLTGNLFTAIFRLFYEKLFRH